MKLCFDDTPPLPLPLPQALISILGNMNIHVSRKVVH